MKMKQLVRLSLNDIYLFSSNDDDGLSLSSKYLSFNKFI